jgi:hypothetical protein
MPEDHQDWGGVAVTQGLRTILFAGFVAFLLLALGVSANADPLDNWHVRYGPLGLDQELCSVAYGNDTFVAVGLRSILTSQDSIRWVSRTSPVEGKDFYLRSIIFANNIFVAVGARGTILTSSNGFTWKKRNSGISGRRDEYNSRTLYRVAYGNGKFVVVGSAGIILTSSDGIKWSRKNASTTLGLYGLTFGNGIFVAVGHNGTILTSSDGNSWNQQASQDSPWLFCVAYGNGTFVAAGDGVFTSPDGITWAPLYPTPERFYDAVFANNIFVMVGHSSIVTSPDGVSWTPTAAGLGGGQGVVFANNTFVVVGGYGITEYILTSPDSDVWTVRMPDITIRLFNSVTYAQNKFVAVGGDWDGEDYYSRHLRNHGAVLTSPDGVTWTQAMEHHQHGLTGVAFGNNTFVAVGYEGAVVISTDTITWTEITTPTQNDLSAVTYANGMFVAVGAAGIILTSPDGIEWTQRVSPTGQDLYTVAFGNNTFVATGYSGTIITSPDGIDWTQRTWAAATEYSRLTGIAFAKGLFVAVGHAYKYYYSNAEPILITSPDGIEWTTRTPAVDPIYGGSGLGLRAVTFADNTFVAVGSSHSITTSPDGITWTLREWEYYKYGGDFSSVIFGNNTFVAVGSYNFFVVQSDPVAGEYYNLIVDSSGPGTVTSLLPGINCGNDCSETFFQNTHVTLLATPDPDSAFTGWTGCDTVDGYFCTVIMNSAKNVSAGFITVDLTGPTVVIRKPPDGKTLTTATTLVSGTATDSKKGNNGIVQVMVNGERAVNDIAEGKQKARWIANIPLELGDNVITVIATDGAGNTTTTTRAVTRLPENLSISARIAQNH